MHGKRRRRSPLHQDVDTAWADKVYTKETVDKKLEESGYYTEGSTRGTKIKVGHYEGKNVGGGKTFLGEINL